jgi:hypothetical protein
LTYFIDWSVGIVLWALKINSFTAFLDNVVSLENCEHSRIECSLLQKMPSRSIWLTPLFGHYSHRAFTWFHLSFVWQADNSGWVHALTGCASAHQKEHIIPKRQCTDAQASINHIHFLGWHTWQSVLLLVNCCLSDVTVHKHTGFGLLYLSGSCFYEHWFISIVQSL